MLARIRTRKFTPILYTQGTLPCAPVRAAVELLTEYPLYTLYVILYTHTQGTPPCAPVRAAVVELLTEYPASLLDRPDAAPLAALLASSTEARSGLQSVVRSQ